VAERAIDTGKRGTDHNLWLELKKEDNTITALYDYWILGKNAVPTLPG
jgi:hypothetical protein